MKGICFKGIAHVLVLISILVCSGESALGVATSTNAWIKSTSGNWEESQWSLGTLPGSGQAIFLANSGWKAVAIGPSTVQNYPQTLTVDSVTVTSPVDSYNVLLLNFAGFATPLTANDATIGQGASAVILSSSLSVSNLLTVDGTVSHGDYRW